MKTEFYSSTEDVLTTLTHRHTSVHLPDFGSPSKTSWSHCWLLTRVNCHSYHQIPECMWMLIIILDLESLLINHGQCYFRFSLHSKLFSKIGDWLNMYIFCTDRSGNWNTFIYYYAFHPLGIYRDYKISWTPYHLFNDMEIDEKKITRDIREKACELL